jgi:hypothetical protein
MGADWQIRTSGGWSYLSCSGWNENHSGKVEALGHRYRITGDAIEFVNEAASKGSDRRKGMNFPAAVLNDSRATNIEVHGARLVAPFVGVLSFRQFLDELGESSMPVSNARAIAEHRIEGGWFTIVIHPDLFVALNGARV